MFIQDELDSIKQFPPQYLKDVTVLEQDDDSARIQLTTLEGESFSVKIDYSGFSVWMIF